MKRALRLAIFASLISLAGCARTEDPSMLIGKWRADRAQFDGIALPVSPNFEINKSYIILKAPDGTEVMRHPWKTITGKVGELEIEVQGSMGVTLVFIVESKDRIRYKVPFVPASVGFSREQ